MMFFAIYFDGFHYVHILERKQRRPDSIWFLRAWTNMFLLFKNIS